MSQDDSSNSSRSKKEWKKVGCAVGATTAGLATLLTLAGLYQQPHPRQPAARQPAVDRHAANKKALEQALKALRGSITEFRDSVAEVALRNEQFARELMATLKAGV